LYLNTETHAKGRTVYKNDVDAGIIKSCTSNNAKSSIYRRCYHAGGSGGGVFWGQTRGCHLRSGGLHPV